jgi:hypothetical protein
MGSAQVRISIGVGNLSKDGRNPATDTASGSGVKRRLHLR